MNQFFTVKNKTSRKFKYCILKNSLFLFINNWLFNIYKSKNFVQMGIGDWGLGPIPNPQSP